MNTKRVCTPDADTVRTLLKICGFGSVGQVDEDVFVAIFQHWPTKNGDILLGLLKLLRRTSTYKVCIGPRCQLELDSESLHIGIELRGTEWHITSRGCEESLAALLAIFATEAPAPAEALVTV